MYVLRLRCEGEAVSGYMQDYHYADIEGSTAVLKHKDSEACLVN